MWWSRPRTRYLSPFLSACTHRECSFNIFFTLKLNDSKNKTVPAFLLCFIGFETINFYVFFNEKWVVLDQIYSFINKELVVITKKNRTRFCRVVFLETLYKISRKTGKPFWFRHSENTTAYDFHLFSFHFTFRILLTLSFKLARSTCSFYWRYIFSFEYL